MPLRDYLEKEVVSCRSEDNIGHVAALMQKRDVGAVVVTEAGRPVGIVTDRDIAIRCVAEGLDCSTTNAGQIMSPSVETVTLDQGIFEVVEHMRDAMIRRVPVVDERGEAVGLISFDDVFDLICEELNGLREAIRPWRLTNKLSREAA